MMELKVIPTGIPNLDLVLGGGIPLYSLTIFAGLPGTGKTIMAQQILFNAVKADKECCAVYITTLSEPAVKVVRYMQGFQFFDVDLFGSRVVYRDVGTFIRDHSLQELADHIMGIVSENQPRILVIDSFKAINDLADSIMGFRRFCYDVSIRLATAQCTTILIGEYPRDDVSQGAEFAVADGIVHLDITHQHGEERRHLQVSKMRGIAPKMARYPFTITKAGVRIIAHSLTLGEPPIRSEEFETEKFVTGIPGFDDLVDGGILRGRTVILSGVSGTGKTTFALQFLVHGAMNGERGILFSFEETSQRLRQVAHGFGWSLEELEKQGLLRVVVVPQTEIRVEEHLETMIHQTEEFKPRRIVVDSFSVFLHKVQDPALQREKTYHLASLVQHVGAVGLLISDISAGESSRLSRFGVEETVVDGTVVLSTHLEGLKRRRYLEVYKMRASNHVPGRHRMEITAKGINVFYRSREDMTRIDAPSPIVFAPLKKLFRGELAYGSAWLVRGEEGTGKTALARQFAIEGLKRGEGVLYISADAPAYLVLDEIRRMGMEPESYLRTGQFVVVDVVDKEVDLTDPEAFLFTLGQMVSRMRKPCRKIFDSLTPLALGMEPGDFIDLVHRKIRLLRRPDVSVFDVLLSRTLEQSGVYTLLNAFDVVVDLFTPDWGEMNQVGQGKKAIRIRKARGVPIDTRPFPYALVEGKGIIVQEEYYR